MVYAGLWSFCMDTKDPLAGCTGVGEPGNLAGVCPGQYRTVTLTGTGIHAC